MPRGRTRTRAYGWRREFKDIHVNDMDTIDISNLNRQFLFECRKIRQGDRFTVNRVSGVKVTPYFGEIQDNDDGYYLQFNLVICDSNSVEARRWINATKLVNLVDPKSPESLKQALIDGGIEDKKMDTDAPDHITWLYTIAAAQAQEFNIEGVTWSLTQGVVKSIIPAIASTNAIIAASCCNEAFKIATSSAACLYDYFMLIGIEGVYSYTYIQIKNPSLSTPTKQLYLRAPPQEATRPNLFKTTSSLISDRGEVTVTAGTLPLKYVELK
ncbi:hypothetical protein FB446DRAFT_810170 [Lentinula raphanica]|nr:hypothetical protein FB446DRAFT_810170 [Lentinula raphanica]